MVLIEEKNYEFNSKSLTGSTSSLNMGVIFNQIHWFRLYSFNSVGYYLPNTGLNR